MFCLAPPRLSLAENVKKISASEHEFQAMVGGRHYACTTGMNSVRMVGYFVAQFSESTFIETRECIR